MKKTNKEIELEKELEKETADRDRKLEILERTVLPMIGKATHESADRKKILEESENRIRQLEQAINEEKARASRKRKANGSKRNQEKLCEERKQVTGRLNAREKDLLSRQERFSNIPDNEDSEDDDEDSEETLTKAEFESYIEVVKDGNLALKLQGLRSKIRSESEKDAEKANFAPLQTMAVETVNSAGREYHRNECYEYELNKEIVAIGIRGFVSENMVFPCLVVPYSDTFLGMEEDGVSYKPSSQFPPFWRVEYDLDPIPLKELGNVHPEVKTIPDWVYKPQVEGDWMHFAYYFDGQRERCGRRHGEFGALDLFAGAGGMTYGLHQAGFSTVCAVEKDSKAAAAFQANNPNADVVTMDINEWVGCEDSTSNLSLVLHVHASSPCKSFSGANINGGKDDKENSELALSWLKVIEKRMPITVSFENVLGMWRRQHMHYLKMLIEGLMKLGYQVRCCRLDASDFGDPTSRPRLFIFGARKFAYLPEKPLPTHGPKASMPHVTVKESLHGIFPEGSIFGNAELLKNRDRIVGDAPAATIRASAPPPIHYEFNRELNINELKALFSLPPEYKLFGSEREQRRQLGNMVSAELAAAVGRSFAAVLKFKYSNEGTHSSS